MQTLKLKQAETAKAQKEQSRFRMRSLEKEFAADGEWQKTYKQRDAEDLKKGRVEIQEFREKQRLAASYQRSQVGGQRMQRLAENLFL